MKNNSGGALLFSLITAFVLSLVSATFVFLTSNQYRTINSEIERTKAFYRAQAGMEYAIYKAYTDPTWLTTTTWPYDYDTDGDTVNDVGITIKADPTGNSEYQISVTANYQS